MNCVETQWIPENKGFATLLTFIEFLSSKNGFITMKTIEVCKGFIILNRFMRFLTSTYSFMKMKTAELCSLDNINKLTVFHSFPLL